eukprot:scaffold1404_cov166-Amphora_coffeaeformis.AAC.16
MQSANLNFSPRQPFLNFHPVVTTDHAHVLLTTSYPGYDTSSCPFRHKQRRDTEYREIEATANVFATAAICCFYFAIFGTHTPNTNHHQFCCLALVRGLRRRTTDDAMRTDVCGGCKDLSSRFLTQPFYQSPVNTGSATILAALRAKGVNR